MSNWYNAVEHIVNCQELLAIAVISLTKIACKVLDVKREKQLLNFIEGEAPNEIHMGIADGNTHYEIDLK